MIHATVSGNLGKDAELKDHNGTPVASFSVASNSRDKAGEKQTTWVLCRMYGKRAIGLAQYLTKGSRVVAVGTLRAWVHEDKASIGLDVTDVDLLGGGQRNGEARTTSTSESAPSARATEATDDNIPF